MKSLLFILLSVMMATPVTDKAYEAYIQKYSDLAKSEMKRTGVPASITLAQALVESAAGRSTLAVKANNHFGIKCHSDWRGRKIYRDDDAAKECFRVYPVAEASYRDHSDFIRYKDRYKPLFDLDPYDYKAWAKGLKEAGYATDPAYASKLIKVIEDYELYRFDTDTETPAETPLDIEKPVVVTSSKAKEVYRFSMTRPVYEINGVPCVYALPGDTYKDLAAYNNLFLKELLSYNDLKQEVVPETGDIIYLRPKKARAARGVDKYIVGSDDETLRGIAQRFGVKMSAVRRLNKLTADYQPKEGDTLLLRRR